MNDVVVTERGFEVMTREAVVPVEFDSLAAAAQLLLAAKNPRLARLDRPTLAALIAAHVVLTPRAGLDTAPQPEALLVFVDEGCTSADRAYWRTARDRGGADASPQAFAATLPSAVAGELAMTFGLRGPCLVLAGETDPGACRIFPSVLSGGPCLVVRIRGWDAPRGGEATARIVLPGEATSARGPYG